MQASRFDSLPAKTNGIIARNGKIIIPNGSDHIEQGDNLIIITSAQDILDIDDIYME